MHYLNKYPLEEHYTECIRYLNQTLDRRVFSDKLKEQVVCLEISDAIALFAHLELDENYKLFCYISSEYHGTFGRVAAVKNGDSIDAEGDTGGIFLRNFQLPEKAVPPMEAIYHDGTAEGYLESVLCKLFLDAMPYTYHEQSHWRMLMDSPPADFAEKWEVIVDIADWRPRLKEKALTTFQCKVENGLGASDGRDRLYLTQFAFLPRPSMYLSFAKNKYSHYGNHLMDDSRYTATRHSCVFTTNSVLIAREK